MISNCGLYVHVPFCVKKCEYCDFVSFSDRNEAFERYAEALAAEAEFYSEKYRQNVFDSVYFGGGTPSVLPTFLIGKIAQQLKNKFAIDKNAEWTIEVNPATASLDKAEELKKIGFDRVSIGMQSNDDKTLRFLGRVNDAKQFEETLRNFQSAGFENINADFILGLPRQTKENVGDTVKYLDGLGVRHVSAYTLILEKGTPLYKKVKHGEIVLPDDDYAVDLYDAFVTEASKCGFCRYEVSNFAKKGYHSRHNFSCWNYNQYLGLGLSAQSFMFGKRFTNVRDLDKYIERIESGKNAVSSSKKLSAEEMKFEFIMLGLRLERGLDAEKYKKLFGTDFLDDYGNIMERLIDRKLVEMEGSFVKVNPDKFYILNSILTEFII